MVPVEGTRTACNASGAVTARLATTTEALGHAAAVALAGAGHAVAAARADTGTASGDKAAVEAAGAGAPAEMSVLPFWCCSRSNRVTAMT